MSSIHDDAAVRIRSAVVIAVVSAVLVGSAVAAPGTDPKLLVLRLDDIPAGYAAGTAEYVSNRDAIFPGVTAQDLARWGRVSGFEANFSRSIRVKDDLIRSQASTYKTVTGVRESLRASFAVAANPPDGIKYRRISTGGTIGNESRAYNGTLNLNGTKLTVISILWRYRMIKASVYVGGLLGTVNVAKAISLARTQQRRIKTNAAP